MDETCNVCRLPFTEQEWEDRHSDDRGEDCHADCCPFCGTEDRLGNLIVAVPLQEAQP